MSTIAPSDTDVRERFPRLRGSRLSTVVVGVLLAVAIIAAALYAGAQQGWSQIGQGGVNRSLLPKASEVAPDLVAVGADGEVVQLSKLRGQPVWLNFWGSWRPPCRAEMPEMQTAYEQLGPQGMVLFAVSLDESVEDAVRCAQLNGATYLVAGDHYRKGSAAYPIANFPTHIVIDREGIVRDVVLAELNAEQIIERAQVILERDGS